MGGVLDMEVFFGRGVETALDGWSPPSPGRREWKVLCVGRERLDLTLLVIEDNLYI